MNNNFPNFIDDYKRRIKSVTQRILLLEIKKRDENIIQCQIVGSKNNVYVITINNLKPTCNCADYNNRGVICKHIYWLGSKKLGHMNPEYWKQEDISAFIENNKNSNYPKGRNEACPICLELIDYKKELTICCLFECKNSVHSYCWNKYVDISKKTKCVCCRTEWMSGYI